MNSNPWFWGGLSRWEFERNLIRDAVQLRDKNAKVIVPKVNIEAVKARKNALAAKGIMVSTLNANMTQETKNKNIALMAAPRKIK